MADENGVPVPVARATRVYADAGHVVLSIDTAAGIVTAAIPPAAAERMAADLLNAASALGASPKAKLRLLRDQSGSNPPLLRIELDDTAAQVPLPPPVLRQLIRDLTQLRDIPPPATGRH